MPVDRTNKMASTIIGLSTLAVIVWILACAETQPLMVPTSHWKGGYNFTWEQQQGAPVGSLRVTMAIVSPSFAEQNEFTLKHDPLAKGFTKSLEADLDKVLIAKGMTVTGPYESLDMMTYPDKKNADLSLTPDVVLNANIKEGEWSINGNYLIKPIEVTMSGWIALVMREPLSSEKIWIKKIPLQVVSKSSQTVVKAQTVRTGGNPNLLAGKNKICLSDLIVVSGNVSIQPGETIVDGTEEAMADCIQELYKPIMDTAWNYINPQEIKILKEKAAEVRKLKRY